MVTQVPNGTAGSGGGPPAANTYQCPCGEMKHVIQGDPRGFIWIACTKCGSHTAIRDLIGVAAKGPNSEWKRMKARRWAVSRGSKQ